MALWEKSRLPNKHIIKNEYNFGIGITQYEAKRLLFDELKYEQVIFFEDDMIVSDNYLRILQVMLEQFRSASNVGFITAYGGPPKIFSDEEIVAGLNKVRPAFDHLWGWGTWRDRWEKVMPVFDRYRVIKCSRGCYCAV